MAQGIHRVLALRRLTPETFVLRLTREGLAFRAGQHIALRPAGHDEERDYSLYSGEQDPFLEVLVREVPGGGVSPRLGAARVGDDVRVTGPTGVFVLDPRDLAPGGGARRPLLLVATGTGIAPYHAMFRTWPDLAATVVHGVRYGAEGYERDDYPAGRHVLCTSRERSAGAFHGRVTDWLRKNPPAAGAGVFLCGNAHMIDDALRVLMGQGVPPQAISTEVYF